MRLWVTLRDAVIGWRLLLTGSPDWRERFRLTGPGLVTAFGLFAVIVMLGLSVASLDYGLPRPEALVAGLIVQVLPIAALLLAIWITRKAVGGSDSWLGLLVPAIYLLMAFVLLEGMVMALAVGPLVMLTWIVLGYGYFRLARAATVWSRGVSASFAILAVLLLVAMRIALYILSNPPASPI